MQPPLQNFLTMIKTHNIPQWKLSKRQLYDLELIQNGAFSPLQTFLNQQDYQSVLEHMRLQSGALWPIPVVLDVPESFLFTLKDQEQILLVDPEETPLATLTIKSYYYPNKLKEAQAVYGTTDKQHRGVNYLLNQSHAIYLSGELHYHEQIIHYDYPDLIQSPSQIKAKFKQLKWNKIIAFQTRNPMHRAHIELTQRAMQQHAAQLLLQPVIGTTQTGDVSRHIRIHCYQSILKYYPKNSVLLSLLPLSMRMAGPREALWHALIRKNYGCSHFIVGRDHAGPSTNGNGEAFYQPYAAQQLVEQHQVECGITMIPFAEMVYSPSRQHYIPHNELKKNEKTCKISGSEFRQKLIADQPIPEWYSYPEVVDILKKSYPPLYHRGFTVFFTGLSGSGKSTLAKALKARLLALNRFAVSLLDGDIVRENLSSELGFSKKDRDTNVRRIGFVAAELTKHRGTVICAPIAPYHATRQAIRERISQYGGFIEVYLSTPLEVCETRDRKGLYKLAREGKVEHFTGISDVYEPPLQPEVTIDTSQSTPQEAVEIIVNKLIDLGYCIKPTN